MAIESPCIERRPFPEAATPFLEAYQSGDHKLTSLYDHFPLSDPPRIPNRVTSAGPIAHETAERIRRLNRDAGATGASAANLDHLEDPETRYVITGQQPGLLLGPPLALYKLITAAAVARRWSEESDRAVIPLFWIASHDSDRDEIDHIFLPDNEGDPRKIRCSFPPGPNRMQVGGIRVEKGDWATFLASVRSALPPSGFRDPLVDRLAPFGDGNATLTELFARCLHQLLPGSGAVLFDGRDAEHDPRGRILLAAAARHPGRTVQAIQEGTSLVKQMGLGAPLPAPDERIPLFLLEEGVRSPVSRSRDRLVPEGGESVDAGALADRIERGEIRTTPSAALRPVVQDGIFPSLATVVGHSELLYHAQLGPLYRTLGVARPPLLPRASIYLMHLRSAERLAKTGVEPGMLLPGLSRPSENGELEKRTAEFIEKISHDWEGLLRHVDQIAPGAVPPGDPARTRLSREARRLADRISKLADRAGENRRNLIHRVRSELFPGGRPQEHVTSLLLALARYGPGFLRAVAAEVVPGRFLPDIFIIDSRGER